MWQIKSGLVSTLRACRLAASAADAPATAKTPTATPASPAPGTTPGAPPSAASISTTLLPEDKSRALVIRTCAVCHPPELLASKARTVETWDRLISKMVDYGARADDDQQIEILTYFATYFLGTDTSIGAPAPTPGEASPAK
jgi:hypothetical protein